MKNIKRIWCILVNFLPVIFRTNSIFAGYGIACFDNEEKFIYCTTSRFEGINYEATGIPVMVDSKEKAQFMANQLSLKEGRKYKPYLMYSFYARSISRSISQ